MAKASRRGGKCKCGHRQADHANWRRWVCLNCEGFRSASQKKLPQAPAIKPAGSTPCTKCGHVKRSHENGERKCRTPLCRWRLFQAPKPESKPIRARTGSVWYIPTAFESDRRKH